MTWTNVGLSSTRIMHVALSFVPLDDVDEIFAILNRTSREGDFKPILTYFDKTYVNRIPSARSNTQEFNNSSH